MKAVYVVGQCVLCSLLPEVVLADISLATCRSSNSPKNPHSAPASGGNNISAIDTDPVDTAYVLYGAVVGGRESPSMTRIHLMAKG